MFELPPSERFVGLSDAWRRARKADQLMFGIIQGGLFEDLAAELCRRDVGCRSKVLPSAALGSAKAKSSFMRSAALPSLAARRSAALFDGRRPAARHLNAVRAGFDMFDCVIPTRNARNGTFTLGRARSTSSAPSSPAIHGRLTETAAVIAAEIFPAPICVICTWQERFSLLS